MTIISTGGCYDCGGRCVLKVHVKDGVAVRVETDDGDEPQLRACVRGRAYRRQVYSQERLRFPLKRVGPRGEGQFERTSWDDALETVAGELRRIKETHGPDAILLHTYSAASVGTFHNGQYLHDLLRRLGDYTSIWGGASSEGSVFANRATYGTLSTANTRDDLVNSRLIILWGLDPTASIYSTNTSFYLAQAKEAGSRIVVIDPRYTNTVASFADQWIPIRPGTDTAMMAAMAYVMVNENLYDRQFLDKFTVGFDKFKKYIMGTEDGEAKTPTWAEVKTGVPADVIINLAREYATVKPAALIPSWAPGRTAFGEQYHRMASTLAAMTANIGVHGGGAAGHERGPMGDMLFQMVFSIPEKSGAGYEEQVKALDVPRRLRTRPHTCKIWDAILKGKAGGYPSDIKMAYIAFANPLNQFLNINKGIEALKKLEFIVVHEQFMTATARFADILLPVATVWERNDLSWPWITGDYLIYQNKVIEPLTDVKTDRDICSDLSSRLGISEPSLEVPVEKGISNMVNEIGGIKGEAIDFEKFKQDGVYKMHLPDPQVCFEKQIKDPQNNPFPTPSGKIEIYCQAIADLNNPQIPPIPKHIDVWEGPADPLIEKYPLQLINFHHKTRAHSCFDNNSWLRELEPQSLWLSSEDAGSRGIENGDKVRALNDRGETIIQVKVTERIMPGVVALGEGAWYQPDDKGRDRSGSPNVLSRDHYSPGGAFPSNTCLVQVERFDGL
ncbi:molybdopterin-dependent oxidoreductase [Chloroflexota bacterium]